MKLKHLPKLAIIALAIGVLAVLSGTTYAVVKTVEHIQNVQLNSAATNEFGREELSVSFEGCKDSQKNTTYELKQGGNLSTEDGVKTLQARCDMEAIDAWYVDVEPVEIGSPHVLETVDTITAINGNAITLEKDGVVTLEADSKVVKDGKTVVSADELTVGATVFAYPGNVREDALIADRPLRLFILNEAPEYYGITYQSYVRERAPCAGNEEVICLQASNINHVSLTLTYGGGINDPTLGDGFQELQGRIVSYTNTSITIDTGNNKTYTITTPSNIIESFNTSTVYGLTNSDNIFGRTDPEALKIKEGDSLELALLLSTDKSSGAIAWSSVKGVGLLVERTPDDIGVVRKY